MISELKEALTELVNIVENVSEEKRCPDLIDSFTTQPARKILASLESQEARLREWEVKLPCDKCADHSDYKREINNVDFTLQCAKCHGIGSTTRPATFDDVMEAINKVVVTMNEIGSQNVYFKLPDGRELRKKNA